MNMKLSMNQKYQLTIIYIEDNRQRNRSNSPSLPISREGISKKLQMHNDCTTNMREMPEIKIIERCVLPPVKTGSPRADSPKFEVFNA